MNTGNAAEVMARAKLGLKYLPICAPDFIGSSKSNKEDRISPGKSPTIKNWREAATENPDTIIAWFKDRPNRNLGMLLGAVVGIVGFDVDGQYGYQKMEELFNGNIPSTWQFSTPGGGTRFLFAVSKEKPLRKYTDAKPNAYHQELSLLADGQMTVIPPSIHTNGGKYLWITGKGPQDIPLAKLPEAIIKKLHQNKAKSLSLERETSNTSQRSDSPTSSKNFENHILNKRLLAKAEKSSPHLATLIKKCRVLQNSTLEQGKHGCAEQRWFEITSMLIKAGYSKAALAFSQLSIKHDERSKDRIRQMHKNKDSTSYGSTTCKTLGCDSKQILLYHGALRKNEINGNITNSPVALLSNEKNNKAQLLLDTYSELLASRYSINKGNLCQVKPNKKGSLDHSPLANFVARITKVITKDDGAEQNTFYEIDGAIINPEKRLPSVLVPSSDFESMKWLGTQWGPEPNVLPGNLVKDTVRHAIQSTAAKATSEKVFTHLGWVKINEKWKYLHAGGALGVSNVKTELDTRLHNYKLSEKASDPVEAMQASLKLLEVAPYRVTLILWSLVYLAPLCEMLKQLNLEPKFLVWLSGYTGTRKTSLAMLFLNHFGEFTGTPPASFKDTANSVEKRSFDAKDSLLLIDDFHPTSSPKDKKDMEQVAQKILRGYGDRVSRGRMKQDTSLRQDYVPRGMALVTAEDMISGGSSVARLVPAELYKSDVNLDLLTTAQQDTQKLGAAMSGYLRWIEKIMNAPLDSYLKDLFLEKRKEATNSGIHGRLIDASAMLYIGLYLGLEYAESISSISTDQKEKLLKTAWETFIRTANEQGEQVSEVKASTRFITIVSEMLANGSLHCDEVPRSAKPELVSKHSAHVGWYDDNYYYFLPELIYNEVNQFLAKRNEQFPVSANMLWKELTSAGLTHTENSNGNTRHLVKKKIYNDRPRLLWVKRNALHEEVKSQSEIRAAHRAELSAKTTECTELNDLE